MWRSEPVTAAWVERLRVHAEQLGRIDPRVIQTTTRSRVADTEVRLWRPTLTDVSTPNELDSGESVCFRDGFETL